MSVRYRNKKTGSVAVFAQVMPRLDRDDKKWERLDDDKPAKKTAVKSDGDEGDK